MGCACGFGEGLVFEPELFGYGADEEAFHLAYVPQSLRQYALWLPVLFFYERRNALPYTSSTWVIPFPILTGSFMCVSEGFPNVLLQNHRWHEKCFA